MTYVKAAVVGVVTALLAAVLWIAGNMFWLASSMAFGSGGIGAVSVGFGEPTVVLAMLIGFIIGFAWMLWRNRRRQSLSS